MARPVSGCVIFVSPHQQLEGMLKKCAPGITSFTLSNRQIAHMQTCMASPALSQITSVLNVTKIFGQLPSPTSWVLFGLLPAPPTFAFSPPSILGRKMVRWNLINVTVQCCCWLSSQNQGQQLANQRSCLAQHGRSRSVAGCRFGMPRTEVTTQMPLMLVMPVNGLGYGVTNTRAPSSLNSKLAS